MAAGYFLTAARLANLGVPASAVMAALPRDFYIGEAVHSMLLPFVISLTLGVVWVLGPPRWVDDNQLPSRGWWAFFGFSVGIYAWIAATLPNRITSLGSQTADGYVPSLVAGLIFLALASMALGYLGRTRLGEIPVPERTNWGRFKLNASITVVICVVGASLFRIIDARFIPDPSPVVAVYTERKDCAPVPAPDRSLPGCPIVGYYFGEGDQWLYLIQTPDPRIPAVCELKDRLLLIPRDDIRRSVLAKNFDSLPRVSLPAHLAEMESPRKARGLCALPPPPLPGYRERKHENPAGNVTGTGRQ